MSKQVKSLLKAAKQLIQEKSYDAALQQCKDLLMLDPQNYNGLVFTGLCNAELNKREESLASYHLAIKSQPTQVLAYQGLINLYTKHWVIKLSNENTDDLIAAYGKLINLIPSTDGKKLVELSVDLSRAYISVEKYSEAFSVFGNSPLLKLDDVYMEIIHCLKAGLKNARSFLSRSDLIFQAVVHSCQMVNIKTSEKVEALKLMLLFIQCDSALLEGYTAKVVSLIQSMSQDLHKSSFIADCLIQIYLQDAHVVTEAAVVSYLQSFEDYDGRFKDIYEGYCHNSHKSMESCTEFLVKGLKVCPDFMPAHLLLNKTYLTMHKWNMAEVSARSSLQQCKILQSSVADDNSSWFFCITPLTSLKLEFTLCLADALCGANNCDSLEMAVGTYEKLMKIMPNSISVYLGLAKAFVRLEEWHRAKEALKKVEALDPSNSECKTWKALITFKEGNKLSAIKDLQHVVTEDQTCAVAYLQLGKLMWETDPVCRQDKSKCLSMFLKAAKLNVYEGETFLYLGHFYRDIAKDNAKTIRCYEKANNLIPKSEEIGPALADQYLLEGNVSAAIQLYEAITDDAAAGTCKWAWLRLGLCRLKTNETSSAIKCFQAALRADMNDHISWECLGEGYLSRGSYTAAWKAFNRAHELEPTSVYSIYQMAALKQILCQFPDAISEYMDVLAMCSEYVPALKGLAESHLLLGKIMLSEGRYLTCVDHVNEAIKHLATSLRTRASMSCLWKLLADCMTIVHPLDASIVHLKVPSFLLSDQDNIAADEMVKIEKSEALQLGGKFYVQSLRLHDCASVWNDLGANYFYQAEDINMHDEAVAMAAKALKMLQKAISLEKNNHILWNNLGVVASSKYIQDFALSQHSFIQSIQCEPNNVAAWSNLGCFYLERSRIEMAHKAFKTAQSLDPAFVNSWIGQAIVAESIGSEESMDLFRHATELSLHDQAGVGYATWVCNVLSEYKVHKNLTKYKGDIHELNALPAAVTQMSKYCDKHPKCEWALSLFGFLLEESGLNRSAESAYKQSLDLLEARLAGSNEAERALVLQNTNKARSDYARILYKNKDFRKSVDAYKTMSSLVEYQDICGLALSLNALGKFKEAYEHFNQASQLTKSENECTLAKVAMAVLSWKQKSLNQAEELLRSRSSQSIEVKQVLCAIGILEKNSLLIQQSLDRLIAYDVINKKLSDVTVRNCQLIVTALMTFEPRKSSRMIQKYVHRYPNEWRFRHLMSQLMLVTCKNGVDFNYLCAEQARMNYEADERMQPTESHLQHRSNKELMKLHAELLTNYTLSLLGNGIHRCDNSRSDADALKSAQRFVHCHPYFDESWFVLSGACHARGVLSKIVKGNSDLPETCQRISSYLSNQSDDNRNAWAIKQNMLSCLMDEKYGDIDELASQVVNDFEEADAIATVSECTRHHANNENISDDVINAMNDVARSKSATTLSKLLVSHVYECTEAYHHAYSVISDAYQCSVDRNERLKLLIRMTALAFNSTQREAANREHWLAISRDSLESINKLEGNAPITQLFSGLVQMRSKDSKNLKKAVRPLTKVFSNTESINSLCISRSIAAWYLYKIYHKKNDAQELEKLLNQWKDWSDTHMDKIKELLPYS